MSYMVTENYEEILSKMLNVIDDWINRCGTLLGRILIVNTLMESLFVYKLSVLEDMPEKLIIKLETAIDNYLWKGKKARIAAGGVLCEIFLKIIGSNVKFGISH